MLILARILLEYFGMHNLLCVILKSFTLSEVQGQISFKNSKGKRKLAMLCLFNFRKSLKYAVNISPVLQMRNCNSEINLPVLE